MKTGFFAIGLAEWRQACEIGLNPAVAFLVLACGTGPDNRTSAWSANSVQTYGGIRWERAKPAIDQLIKAGLVTLAESSTKARPRYKLKLSEDRIWLPKNIVMPLAGEEPIVHRLRQVQDVMVLRLFVELYDAQNLAADGGIARSIYSRKYEKKVCRDVGNMAYLGFTKEHNYMTWGVPVVDVHKGPKKESAPFFDRMKILKDMGLVQEAAYLFESSGTDAEILFPVDGPEPEESQMRWEAENVVATNLQGGEALIEQYDYVIPVYRHQQSAELYGIYRMRFRAHTANTSAWYARLRERVGSALTMFRAATT
ncbi:hypothetical protein [Herbaspirillum sp. SJZ107]|uniref:hypothetical protein n=1 Tax=Herbaspirillum sp. SJZ107 TaxID=2572881 RepID=UPI00114E2D6C|nr:hypothetical protein [Herbaspirillum sp. SJZ107]TQK00162.1 hypothetical protein FBX97_5827 [Herbaspirillum sp. SJZ107]